MKVTLFKAFPDPYRKSMAVYVDRLTDALRALMQEHEEVTAFIPQSVALVPRPARYWSQYVGYQLGVPFAQGDVNHVVDHAYGHLLHTLDPARTVVTFHDAIGLKARNGNLDDVGRRRISLVQRYNLTGLRKAAAIICDSEASRKDFLEYAGSRSNQIVEVITQGVDTAFFTQGNGDPKRRLGLTPGRYLLHVGHTRFYKNIPALFHVLSILVHAMGEDTNLLKVGEGFTPEQEKLATALGVWNRIVHLGMVADEQLPDVYRCADVLLFPSYHEGFGLPVIEAMASGLPVVASNRGSLPEVVGNAGVLVDPEDYEAMAKAISSILDRPAWRAELQERGFRRAQLFTWQKTAERTLEIYRNIYRAARI